MLWFYKPCSETMSVAVRQKHEVPWAVRKSCFFEWRLLTLCPFTKLVIRQHSLAGGCSSELCDTAFTSRALGDVAGGKW